MDGQIRGLRQDLQIEKPRLKPLDPAKISPPEPRALGGEGCLPRALAAARGGSGDAAAGPNEKPAPHRLESLSHQRLPGARLAWRLREQGMMEQVPLPEITSRAPALQKALAGQNLDLALVHQAADLFYYAGTLVDGFLAVAPQGSPLLLVRRPQSGAAPHLAWPQVFYANLKEIPALLGSYGLKPEGAVGLELDVMPTGVLPKAPGTALPAAPHPGRLAADPAAADGQEFRMKSGNCAGPRPLWIGSTSRRRSC